MSVSKSAKALVATTKMDAIILERFLTKALPKSNKICLKKVYKYTGYKYYRLRNYIHSDLYTVSKDTIDITYDAQLLSDKSKKHIENLIKKVICPVKYENNRFVSLIAKMYDNSYFTDEEQKFIELMTNELFLIIDRKEISRRPLLKDLVDFHCLNRSPFLLTARQVYNDILQKKIYAGDNIMEYINKHLTDTHVTEKLKESYKFDYFFDNNGILKCDLDTNRNILIKNFLSTIFYNLSDDLSRIILLRKLNSKYPFLIMEKIFNEYD